MRLEITATRSLAFTDGSPVRAASAIVAYADGWLIAQDDSTIGALEAACVLPDGTVLGSGSSPTRCRGIALSEAARRVEDLTALHTRVAATLTVPSDVLNLEGACVVGGRLRWFHRGLPAPGRPSARVDLPLDVPLGQVEPRDVLRYDLGSAAGVDLAVTDAVALDDGLVFVSAAAEDSPNSYDDAAPALRPGCSRGTRVVSCARGSRP